MKPSAGRKPAVNSAGVRHLSLHLIRNAYHVELLAHLIIITALGCDKGMRWRLSAFRLRETIGHEWLLQFGGRAGSLQGLLFGLPRSLARL